MTAANPFTRPTLGEALDAWKKLLAERRLPTNLLWLFAENLCLEKSRAAPGGLHFAFQTRFTPAPENALEIAFDHFSGTRARMAIYHIGVCRGQSLSILLCDSWFDGKGESEGYLRRDEWHMSFHPAAAGEIEEITELSRWLRRARHGRSFHDLDFCMTLAAIDEIRTYGRPLAHYERFAQALLNRLRRVLGQPA
ncbi:MAG: hypothetical protein ABSA45_05430 [Verrucomicrobiota bacterium]|jgi:hypothetical protein